MTINWSFFSPFALVMIPSKDVCDPNAIRFPLNISKHIVSCPPGLAHCQGLSRLLGLLRSSLWSTVSQQIGGSMGKLHGCSMETPWMLGNNDQASAELRLYGVSVARSAFLPRKSPMSWPPQQAGAGDALCIRSSQFCSAATSSWTDPQTTTQKSSTF